MKTPSLSRKLNYLMSSFITFVALLAVGCGPGGGGGYEAQIEAPLGSYIDSVAPEQFIVYFPEGIPDSFTFTLNDNDVTQAFTRNTVTNRANAPGASIAQYLVSGTNTFRASLYVNVQFIIDDEGPDVHILGANTPSPGSVDVNGYLTDISTPVSLDINSTPAGLDDEYAFDTSINTAPRFDFLTEDFNGAQKTTMVLRTDETVEDAFDVHVSATGVTHFGDAMAEIFSSANADDLTRIGLPGGTVYSASAGGMSFDIELVGLSAMGADVAVSVPSSGVIGVAVDITSLVYELAVSANGSAPYDATLTVNNFYQQADATPSLAGTQLQMALNTNSQFSTYVDFDTSNLPGNVETAAQNLSTAALSNALDQAFADELTGGALLYMIVSMGTPSFGDDTPIQLTPEFTNLLVNSSGISLSTDIVTSLPLQVGVNEPLGSYFSVIPAATVGTPNIAYTGLLSANHLNQRMLVGHNIGFMLLSEDNPDLGTPLRYTLEPSSPAYVELTAGDKPRIKMQDVLATITALEANSNTYETVYTAHIDLSADVTLIPDGEGQLSVKTPYPRVQLVYRKTELTTLSGGFAVAQVAAEGRFTALVSTNRATLFAPLSSISLAGGALRLSSISVEQDGFLTLQGDICKVNGECDNGFSSVSGSLTGASGDVWLQLNGAETLTLTSNQAFSFATKLPQGASYNVEVISKPLDQSCTVINANGTISGDVTDIQVVCDEATYTIGGSAANVVGSIDIQLNEFAPISIGNGSFSFPDTLLANAIYNVTVPNQPEGQTCTVTNGLGVATADVTNIAINCSYEGIHDLGGNVSGLNNGSITLRVNALESVVVTSDGPYSFPSKLIDNASYTVIIIDSPLGQDCIISNASGTATADVNDVNVSCSIIQYGIGGNVLGLNGTVSLSLNGGETINVNGNGNTPFSFSTTLTYGEIYTVVLETQPAGQDCTLSSGTGTINNEVDNIVVNCITNTYSIGGGVQGLTGTVVLTLNGAQPTSISNNGGFNFLNPLAHGTGYTVAIQTQPFGQVCSLINASGVAEAVVTNVGVSCTTATYTISGNASGLTGTAILKLNDGESLEVTADGSLEFTTQIDHGAAYDVQIDTHPVGQTCTLADNTGTATANVSNIALTCTTNTYTIGGSASGTTGNVTLTLNGGSSINVGNGAFTFATSLDHGQSYVVAIAASPSGQTCSIANSSGTTTANVTNVAVTCTTNVYSIGGSVGGLAGTVVLELNGGPTASVSANGSYFFAGGLNHGTAYNVTIKTQPAGQTCAVSNASGTANANVSNIDVSCSVNSYTLGGNISGLNGTIELSVNGSQTLNTSNNGSYTFTNPLNHGASYLVSITSQPLGQSCSVSAGSGVMTGNVSNVQVSCSTINYSVGGSVAGAIGSASLTLNGGTPLSVSNGNFTFPATLVYGQSYTVAISAHPSGQTCFLTEANGTISNDVTNVFLNCSTNSYGVGGSVSGLVGSLVLELNGGQALSINSDGGFTFPTPLSHGSSFAVTVPTQPDGQVCSVVNGTGTLTAPYNGVQVNCVTQSFNIGGDASGMSGTVTLEINAGETLDVSSNGSFVFPTQLDYGTDYTVLIDSAPVGQTCTISSNTGTVSGTVDDIDLSCTTNTYAIGGSLSGATDTVGLQINGGESINVSSNGSFSFPTPLSHDAGYNVQVSSEPTGQDCSISNNVGTATGTVTNISVTCSTLNYSVGGNLSGLDGNIVLTLNGNENLNRSSNGNFTFATALDHGASYSVAVSTQPIGQNCTVSSGSGTMSGQVSNVQVSCTTNTYSIGGSTSGLIGSVSLLLNGGSAINVSGGSFTFPGQLDHGSSYAVTIQSQPTGQSCSVANGNGTAFGTVDNIIVNCSTNTYSVSGSVSGVSGLVTLQITGGQTVTSGNGGFTFGSPLSHGTNYTVTIISQPVVQSCAISNASGTIAGPVSNVAVFCVTNTYNVSGNISGLSGTLALQLNGGETLNTSSNGGFAFATDLISGSGYDVTIANQPAGQTCSVNSGSGTAIVDVTNVSVSCSDNQYTIGGAAAGLDGTLQLRLNGGSNLIVNSDGNFSFGSTLPYGASYNVTINTEPAGQSCAVSNGSGTVSDNVDDITVVCIDNLYSIGGNVSGLTGTVEISLNGGESLQVSQNGGFGFSTQLTYGTAYSVTVTQQPSAQSCDVIANGSGTISGNVSNITVECNNDADWYRIKHRYSSECLQRIGSNVEAQPCDYNNLDQRWLIDADLYPSSEPHSDYTHITMTSVSALSNCVRESSSNVDTTSCNASDEKQIWWLHAAGGDSYRIRNEVNQRCMAASDNGGNVYSVTPDWWQSTVCAFSNWGGESAHWYFYLNGTGNHVYITP